MTTVMNNPSSYQYGAALVPHYGPNNNQYYNNYLAGRQNINGMAPTPAGQNNVPQQYPQHQSYQQQQQQQAAMNATMAVETAIPFQPPAEISFPTPPNSASTSITGDNDGDPHQENNTSEIPIEIVRSQERALAQIKKQQQSQRALTTSFSQQQRQQEYEALVVPPPVTLVSGSYYSDTTTSGAVSGKKNKVLTEAIHPKKYNMKKQRSRRTVGATVGGAVVGGVVLGPAGAILGGAAGGMAANKLCKVGERHAQRNWEQANFQRGTETSKTIQYESVLV